MRTAVLPSSFQAATVRGSRAPRTTSMAPILSSSAASAPPFNPLAPSTRTRARPSGLPRSPISISSSLERQRSLSLEQQLSLSYLIGNSHRHRPRDENEELVERSSERTFSWF